MESVGIELLKQIPSLGVLVYLVILFFKHVTLFFEHVTQQRSDFLNHITLEREALKSMSHDVVKAHEKATEAIKENTLAFGRFESVVQANEQTLKMCARNFEDSTIIKRS